MDTIINRVKNCTNWNNHLPLLYLALETTKKGTVVEMGCGEGSTQFLHDYCEINNRLLRSYDNSIEYHSKYRHLGNDTHTLEIVTEWDRIAETPDLTVALLDHHPGEDRYKRAIQLANVPNIIIVCHDAEDKPNAGNYQFEEAFKHYKYFARVKAPSPDGIHNGTWAVACSNTHDLSKWYGKKFGTWTVEP